MKVLFTHSYFLNFDAKQLKTKTPFPPLATLYAAALLRENGFDVKLADLQFSSSAEADVLIGSIKMDITGAKKLANATSKVD